MLYRIANWLLPTYIVLNWIYIFKKKITEVYSNWDNLLKLKVIHRIQKRISKFFYKLRTSLVCFFCCYQQYKNIIWNSCLDPVNNLFISKIVWTLLFILFSTEVNFPKHFTEVYSDSDNLEIESRSPMSHTFLIWWETLLVLEGKCLEFRTERVQITRYQDRRNWSGLGEITNPDFDRFINHIQSEGDWLCQPHYYFRICRPSNGPTVKNSSSSWIWLGTMFILCKGVFF